MNDVAAEKAICLICATVFWSDYRSDLVCTTCGRTTPRQKYTRLVSSAAAAARFGYQYRERYRADAEVGESDQRHHMVPLDVVFSWIVLAVIGGILENASWEAIQRILKKISVSNARVTGESHIAIIGLIEDREKLARFATDVLAFQRGERIDSVSIEAAVEEEQVVDLMTRISENSEVVHALASAGSEEREMLMASIIDALRAARAEAAPLTEAEVKDLWTQIEISG
jgi:hypothetical protein